MAESRRFSFDQLATADLVIDAFYEGGGSGNVSDDPLGKLLPCGNQGGFRYRKRRSGSGMQFVVLYSDLSDHSWPDVLDVELGTFTYYGDNKHPGRPIDRTQRGGNTILQSMFSDLHADPPRRATVPPCLIFTKGLSGRDVVFRGLAVPGAPGLSEADDLVAIWRSDWASGRRERFQNYRATFTILDVPVVKRTWLDAVLADRPAGPEAPEAWLTWQRRGVFRTLRAPTVRHRSRKDQLPDASDGMIIREIYEYFDDPHDFEDCARSLWTLHAERVDSQPTPRSRDGGRDATGELRIGPESDPIHLDFVLEAKRYALDHPVGVRELARLISRIRHRMFGVLVTTSYLHEQAYQELRADGHPIVVIAARDIVEILRSKGYGDIPSLRGWLARQFPKKPAEVESAPPYELITTP